MEDPKAAIEPLGGLGSVCVQLASAFASNAVDEGLGPQLQSLVTGSLHLSLHVVDREHSVVLASGNMLRPGLLPSSLHPLRESLISAATIAAGPRLWQLDEKRTLIPREIAAVTAATGCTTFATIPLPAAAYAGDPAGTQPQQAVFGFMLAAFPSKDVLTRMAVDNCIALSQALAAQCELELVQHCRLVVSCLLLANHHGDAATGAGGAAGLRFAGADGDDLSDLWDSGEEEDEDEEGLSEGGEGLGGEDGEYRRLLSGRFGGGPMGMAPADVPSARPELKIDPLSLTFALPEAERAFQLYYGANMLKVRKADLLAFLVHALLLLVGILSPFSTPRLTTKQCCQSLAVVLPLPLLLFPNTRQWYCRHRDTLLWLLRLYTLCYMHIRMGHVWGSVAASGHPVLPRLAYVYAWLSLSSITWQLRFSHHLPVTVLAHTVNIALLWQSSCPAGAAGITPLECGMVGVALGTAYLAPAVLVVYYVERRARRLFAAFLPFWE